ncbi:PTS mannose transporter subunit IIAB [Dickeya dianthicola]|uniref:PTS system mannose-specific EIIAB component n=1 Tax=Dickeya dianthicola TaxID=204039 RepID=A0ABX9NS79_9GAMM|nr:PTS mannose transporter subunit IIAB [Dickeya dianthicola]ATO33256.1 PTS system, mannose-specific IIA component PTS system, mannose-specific IIB component [Dickeya dianthicola RNS04.9]MCA7003309.1 PTS mannose transporter subunit IIAB [Dickeya dianthicola]MCI4032358.1 PTS mannose transporter subunit IIAB [Dickeya dianthicola]MCI4068367.1 PTS mannose transporter subunit IIAB [Dickeya dianthicola]MCI4114982.1 PTS mannose transporter subunit IIAB [Dickeya dianthicola]
MSIAIMLCTHGATAGPLLNTAEMILGEQSNVGWIDFVPGENAEILMEKYQAKLAELDTSEGVLFLVDTWGGSPFNAASRLVNDKKNHEVIAGVNIPMLAETFMARDDNPEFGELVAIAMEAGRAGVKALKAPDPEKTPRPEPVRAKPAPAPGAGGHMKIGLARIDDRLIHGQVATRWTKETNVNRIIVVSDEVAADNVRKTLLTQVAPPGVSAHVVDVAKAVRVYNNPKYASDRVMLLFTNPTDVLRLVEDNVKMTSINIGGMAYRQGKTQVNNAVSIDDKDIAAFNKLHERGIELEVRKVSTDTKINMMDLITKVAR